jgi:hypothetical protein
MTLEPLQPQTFDRASPVTAYWLPRCDGFLVVGGRKDATVEHAVFDHDPHRPVALRVRRSRRKTMLIPIDSVEAVTPVARVVYLRRRPSVVARAAGGVWALTPHARRAGRASAAATAAAYRASAAEARRQWPGVRRASKQTLVFAAQATVVFARTAWIVLVAVSIVVARLLRYGYRSARRLAPHGARLANDSVAYARRAFR